MSSLEVFRIVFDFVDPDPRRGAETRYTNRNSRRAGRRRKPTVGTTNKKHDSLLSGRRPMQRRHNKEHFHYILSSRSARRKFFLLFSTVIAIRSIDRYDGLSTLMYVSQMPCTKGVGIVHLVDEEYPGYDSRLALLPPLRHLQIYLLPHFPLDLARVPREKRQETLLPGVDHVDLVQGYLNLPTYRR